MSVFRPRSHSSDSPSTTPHTFGVSRQESTKRGNSQVPVPGNWDMDMARRKRRRRDTSPSVHGSPQKAGNPFTWPSRSGENMLTTNTAPVFATTPAQFNLFPRIPGAESDTSQLPQNMPERQEERPTGYLNDLTRLRSTAFWELRQSVAENGEGMVRRMRDYERSRSRNQVRQRAKESEKRGRKRAPRRLQRIPSVSCQASSEGSDDEDVLICSADSSNNVLHGVPSSGRARSLDAMDVDTRDETEYAFRRRKPHTSPNTYDNSLTLSEQESTTAELPHPQKPDPDLGSAPSSGHSTSQSPSSSAISLLLPPATQATLPTTASEKALTALNIALENGAGSISDYSPVWAYQQQFNAEGYDNGDLWR